MKLIVGLGNPGVKYAKTRHNVGFFLIEQFAAERELKWDEKKRFKAEVAETELNGERVLLAKPTTYMNASGEAMRMLVDFHKLKHGDVLVIHDDADMDFGRLRLVLGEGSGGHQGINSLLAHGIEGTWRLKIGVANEHRLPGQAIDFVLTRFQPAEVGKLPVLGDRVKDLIESFVAEQAEPTSANWLS